MKNTIKQSIVAPFIFKMLCQKIIFCFLGLTFLCTTAIAQPVQNVISRFDAVTGNWLDAANPWHYQTDNNDQNRPDNGNRHFVKIGHNNNTTMTTNGALFQLASLDFEATATSARTINSGGGGTGISLTIGMYNASTATHIINTDISIDAATVQIQANGTGGLDFGGANIFLNNDTLEFGGISNINISNVLSGTGSLIKTGTGTLKLTGLNSYTGFSAVNNGTLQFFRPGGTTIPETDSVAISGTGNLRISSNQTVTDFSMTGGTLTIDPGVTFTITGIYSVSGGNINNNGTLRYRGNSVTFPGPGATVNNGFAGTLANLEIDMINPGTVTLTSDLIISNTLTLNTGNLSVAAYALSLNGPPIAGAATNLVTSSASTLSFGGSSTGIIIPASVIALGGLVINNTNGVSLSGNPTLSGTLNFISGNIITGSFALSVASSGSVTGGGTNGWVIGNLKKNFSTGSNISRTFEIGDANAYAPVTVNFASVSVSNYLSASTTAGDHFDIISSDIDALKSVNRYWTLTNSGINFTNYSATFNFNPADIDAGSLTNIFMIGRYDNTPAWNYPAVGTRTSTSTQVTGITGTGNFGDFAIGELGNYTWTGVTSTDWNTSTNWIGGIPGINKTVILGTGKPRYPVMDQNREVYNVDLQPGATLTLNGKTLTVNGSISFGGGLLKGSATSNIIFNGGGYSALNFDPASAALNNLLFNSSGASLNGSLSIYGLLSLTGLSGFDVNSEHLTLKSTATKTARVAPLDAGSNINGVNNVTVERYIAVPKRAWHLLSAQAVTGSGNSIFEEWQENSTVVPNKGTWITSNLYNGGVNGFDGTSLSASILTHNQGAGAAPSWNYNLASTNFTELASNQGYMLFVRGDRTCTPNNSTITPTVLSTTGSLLTGQPAVAPVISSNGTGYTLIGNPYASPIDMEQVLAPGATPLTDLDQNFYVWDAAATGNFGLGAFVNIARDNAGNYTRTPAGSNTNIRYISSGQAFFLHAGGPAGTGGANNATILFDENCKAATESPVNPIAAVAGDQQIYVNLNIVNAGNVVSLADGLRVRYDNSYTAANTDDILKIGNFAENIYSFRGGKKLIVENRPMVVLKDTIFLRMTNTAIKNYRFEIATIDFVQSGATAFLQDTWLNTNTAINLTGITNNIDFSITADPASANADRFRIVFSINGPLPVTFTSVNAAQQGKNISVEWKVSNQNNIKQYNVERSTDGINFSKVSSMAAYGSNGNSATYNWVDMNPLAGNNFYRIRSIGIDGDIKESKIVMVKIEKVNPAITVYPNPVINGKATILFTDMEKGVYHLSLINRLGQTIFIRDINYSGGTAANSIIFGKHIAAGNYRLLIINPDNSKTTRTVLITN